MKQESNYQLSIVFEVQMLQWLGMLICVGRVGLSSFQIKIKNRNVWEWEWECPILRFSDLTLQFN